MALMKPFCLKATLLRGVVTEQYNLDLAGILASRIWRTTKHAPQVDSMIDRPQDLDLPLDMCDTGSDWHWMATCAAVETDPDRPQEPKTYYRVVNESMMSRAADRPLPYYHPRSSAYRDVMMPAPVTLTPHLKWYGVGDIDAIYNLVKRIRSVGKRRAKGEGIVLKWEIEEIHNQDPWEIAHTGLEKQILRPIPIECADQLGLQYKLEWFCIRPPSWNPNRIRELAVAQEEEMYIPEEWEL